MHVLLVIDRIGVQGGSEVSTLAIVEGLHGRGLRFSIACLYPSPDSGAHRSLGDLGMDVTVLPSGWVHKVRALRRLIRSTRPDLVHAVLFDANMVARAVAPICGVPLLSSLVSTQYDPSAMAAAPKQWKKRIVRWLDMVSGKCAVTRYHAVSASVAEHGTRRLAIHPSRVTVVERGRSDAALGRRSAQRRTEVRGSLGVSEETPVILAIARHEPPKGLAVLMTAMVEVTRQVRDASLLVAGREGSETRTLEAWIGANGLQGSVTLLGNRNDVGDLLAACDCFTLPSLWEGLPGAVLEAMALEAPIVASDLPGVRDAVVENAELVPPGDSEALAEAILRVLRGQSTSARNVGANRMRFEEYFSLEAMLQGMRQLYVRTATERRWRRR